MGYTFQILTVYIDKIEVKRKPLFGLKVTGEQYLFPRRMKERAPVGIAQKGQLFQIASIGITNKELHFRRFYQAFGQ